MQQAPRRPRRWRRVQTALQVCCAVVLVTTPWLHACVCVTARHVLHDAGRYIHFDVHQLSSWQLLSCRLIVADQFKLPSGLLVLCRRHDAHSLPSRCTIVWHAVCSVYCADALLWQARIR